MKKKTRKTQIGLWNFLLDGLWADGILTFVINARFWIIGSWVFVAVWTPLKYFSRDYAHLLGDFAAQAHGGSLIAVAMFFVEVAQVYFFTACYLNQQPVTGTLELKLESFVFVVLLFFFIALVFLLGWSVLIACLAWLPDIAIVKIIVGIALAMAIIIGMLRLCVVIPLAVNGVKSPLLQGWRITSGKSWRLFWNAFVLCLIVATPLVVISVVLRGVAAGMHIKPADGVPAALFLAFVDSALWVMIQGLIWAFFYSCGRTLYGEYVMAHLPGDRRTAQRS